VQHKALVVAVVLRSTGQSGPEDAAEKRKRQHGNNKKRRSNIHKQTLANRLARSADLGLPSSREGEAIPLESLSLRSPFSLSFPKGVSLTKKPNL